MNNTNNAVYTDAVSIDALSYNLKLRYAKLMGDDQPDMPLLTEYLDSPIGSPCEKVIEKMAAVALFKNVNDKMPNYKLFRWLASKIAQTAVTVMGTAKLFHQYNQRKIDGQTLWDELVDRKAASVCRFLKTTVLVTSPYIAKGIIEAIHHYTGLKLELLRYPIMMGIRKIVNKLEPVVSEEIPKLLKMVGQKVSVFFHKVKIFVKGAGTVTTLAEEDTSVNNSMLTQ